MSEVSSVPTPTQTITWNPSKVWVKLVHLPVLNREIKADVNITFDMPAIAGTFYPRGKKWAVVIGDELTKGREFKIEFWVEGENQETVLAEIFSPGRTILIQDVIGINYYAKVSDTITRTQLHSTDPNLPRRWLYKWAVPLTEQQRPAPEWGA